MAEEPQLDRILTVPNVITVVRLGLLPVFVWLLFGRDDRVAAAVLLGVLGATDFLDGYIARHFNQVSTVGKVIDPVADRILFLVAVVAIMIDGSVPIWFGTVVLVREVAVAAATLVLAAMGARRIDVSWYGKAGTFALMFTFPLFLLGNSTFAWAGLAEFLAWGIGLPGVVLSYYAAALYVPMARRALAEGRAEVRELPGA
jgi:cardiolipin synthase